MKPFIVLLIALCLAGCGHLHPDSNVSGAESSAAKFNSHHSLGERNRQDILENTVIDQRTRSHERRGLPSAEARAVAEAEYAKNGR